MSDSLPEYTRTIDTEYASTWSDIQAEAADNILDASVVWAALKAAGCLKPQDGYLDITRTIRYGQAAAQAIEKGDVMSEGEVELKTLARWDWKYIQTHVQRNILDEHKNRGKAMITNQVNDQLTAAREALVTKFEAAVLAAYDATTETTSKEISSLNFMIPPGYTTGYAAGSTPTTFGKLQRTNHYAADPGGSGCYKPDTAAAYSNPWWGPIYRPTTLPVAVNLLDDMRTLYNTISNNLIMPNLIITDQLMYEQYEDFAVDMTQVVKAGKGNTLVDLGFEATYFKGKPMVWSPNMYISSLSHMLMLNTDRIDVVYDPMLWFTMGEWKSPYKELTRRADIICACNIVTNELRRHGRLYNHA